MPPKSGLLVPPKKRCGEERRRVHERVSLTLLTERVSPFIATWKFQMKKNQLRWKKQKISGM